MAAVPAARTSAHSAGTVRGWAEFVLLAVIPLLLIMALAYAVGTSYRPFDFQTFWQSGVDVMHGRSPYPDHLPSIAHEKLFRPFVYPAPAAVVMVPVALLPLHVATVLWAALSVASLLGAIYLLGVRDWRCYGAVFLWTATWSALGDGSTATQLLLACAALWRFRSRPAVSGALLATLVVCKLYFWPVGVWLLVTRRIRAAVWSVVLAIGATLAGWAAIGFAGMRSYPHLIGRLTELVGPNSYSPYALVRSFGGSPELAKVTVFVLGAAVLALVVRTRANDAQAFVLVLAASLVLSPVVWPH